MGISGGLGTLTYTPPSAAVSPQVPDKSFHIARGTGRIYWRWSFVPGPGNAIFESREADSPWEPSAGRHAWLAPRALCAPSEPQAGVAAARGPPGVPVARAPRVAPAPARPERTPTLQRSVPAACPPGGAPPGAPPAPSRPGPARFWEYSEDLDFVELIIWRKSKIVSLIFASKMTR